MNQAESALMSSRLQKMGIQVVPYSREFPPELLFINSCAVTSVAERKVRQCLHSLQKKHAGVKLFLTGCASHMELPDIPGITVFSNKGKRELESVLRGEFSPPELSFEPVFYENIFTAATERTRANLKIQEGCNNFCSYCIIPYKRGRERSRDLNETLKDFRQLVANGFQEITLTGINTCSYDCHGAKLNDLLERLLETDGNYRIRIGSTEPGPMLKKIVDIMAVSNGKLCEFLHPSLQNGSDTILKKMNRHCLTQEYAEYVQYAREKVPHIHIGTDIITGFPGETDQTFQETVSFLEKIRFSNIHIFPFSPREGTAAYTMKPVVPGNVAQQRAEELARLKEICAEEFRRSLIGTVQTVIPERNGIGWSGNYVRVKVPGTGLVRARITGMEDDLLIGNIQQRKEI